MCSGSCKGSPCTLPSVRHSSPPERLNVQPAQQPRQLRFYWLQAGAQCRAFEWHDKPPVYGSLVRI